MLLEIFLTFFKIGAFTFGGGYAMIPIIQEELVNKRKWIEEVDFIDAIALAQTSPGPIAVNVSIYVGHKIKGLKGALVSTLGTVLPSFFTIIIIAMFFYEYRDNPIIDKIFLGVRPAIVAFILSAVYGMAKKSKFGYKKILVSILTVLSVVFLKISPVYLILIGAVGSILLNKSKIK